MLAHQDGEWHLRFLISHEVFFRRRFMARDPDFVPYWHSYQENPGKWKNLSYPRVFCVTKSFLGEYVFDDVKEALDLVCSGRTVVFMGEESLNQYLRESPMPPNVRILWLPMYYGNLIFRHNSPLKPGSDDFEVLGGI